MYCGGEPELYCFNTARYTAVTHRIPCKYTEGNDLQWSPFKTDIIGEMKFVLYKKVSFIQGFLNAVLIHENTI